MTVIVDNVHGLDNVDMPQCHTDAEFGGDLSLVFLFSLTLSPGSELLHRIRRAALLCARLDKTDSTTSARSEHFAPLSVFLRQMGVCGLVKRWVGQSDDGVRNTRVLARVLGSCNTRCAGRRVLRRRQRVGVVVRVVVPGSSGNLHGRSSAGRGGCSTGVCRGLPSLLLFLLLLLLVVVMTEEARERRVGLFVAVVISVMVSHEAHQMRRVIAMMVLLVGAGRRRGTGRGTGRGVTRRVGQAGETTSPPLDTRSRSTYTGCAWNRVARRLVHVRVESLRSNRLRVYGVIRVRIVRLVLVMVANVVVQEPPKLMQSAVVLLRVSRCGRRFVRGGRSGFRGVLLSRPVVGMRGGER